MNGCQRPKERPEQRSKERPEQRPERGPGSGALAATGLRARLWRRGLAVLALALVPLLSAAPEVRAELLIGNLNIGNASNNVSSLQPGRSIAQAFTTGTNAGGYTLESVELFLRVDISAADIGDLVATLRSEGSSGDPDTTLGTLTNPASIIGESSGTSLGAEDAATFTAPSGTVLAANTTYFVVLRFDQGRTMWGASANGEESGGAAGWSIADDSRTNNGSFWITDSSESYYIRVNGTARTNTAPTASNGSVTTTANTTGNRVYAFTAGDFNFADADTGDTLEKVKIVTRPGLGTLALSGTAVSVNQEVSKADIDAGNLTFMPATDATGSPYTTFTFKVNDGEAESTTAYTMTVNVTAASVLSIAFAKTPIAEGTDDTASFTVTRTGSTAAELGFNLSASGTATVVSDYTALSGPTATSTAYTISAGQAGRTVIVSIQNDFTPEPTETLTIAIDALPTYTVHAANGSATLTILDDDRPNSPATGVPAVTGTARVGETLTAVTADIADAEGLPDSFSYQWVRVASGTDTDISGATSSTYTLAGADEGNTVKVEVSFTDDAGNAEGPLTSAATGSVAPPLLSIADASGSEGDSITFTATLPAVSVETVTATWTASVESGDTAASGDLSGTLTGTLTFAPGEPAKTFTVATAEDTVDEVDETFTVTLSGLANATLGDATATGTIDDDDAPPLLSIADASGSEGDSITFTATLSAASAKTVTATWTAASGDLTGALTGTLTFAAGDLTRTFTVATVEDTIPEIDKTFTVTLSNLSNATLTGGTATGTVEDDDGIPVLRIAHASAAEGSAITFTVRLSPASGQTVTVDYATFVATSDTAATGDFTAKSGSLSFSPGDTEMTFTVATTGDAVDEPDETFTVALLAPVSASLRGGRVKGTIVDDDDPPTLSVADASGSEGGDITFTATLSAASAKTVTATWTASVESGDTAASGDLRGTLTGTLTFAPGERTETFTVATAEDTDDEDDETFTVTLSNLSNATLPGGTATGTIEDEDAVVWMRIADVSAAEGSLFTFTARLVRATGRTVTANYWVYIAPGDTAATGDFTAKLGTLSFSPGETEKTITVATAQDTTDEDDETFTVALGGLVNAVLVGGQAKGTIIDDDDPPTLSVGDLGAAEGDGIAFTATLSAASSKTVTATWTASVESGDTAASGDLTGTLAGTLTFAPGERTRTFTVATAEDTAEEPDETFTVTLSNLRNATLTGGTATGTIEDDDGTPVLRIADAGAAEGSAIAFTVRLSPASGQTVTVNYATSVAPGDTAVTGDFTAKSGSLSFGPGDTEKTFSVATTGDAIDEVDETFTVTLSGPANATLGDATATGSIDDDDDPPTLSVADASREEGDAVSFTATLSAASEKTVTATWTASVESGDTAASGDLSGTLTGTLSFAAGQGTRTFTVATAEDTVDEEDKTFTVTLSNLSNATLTGGTATGTIEDDDAAPVLRIADASAAEGSAIAFPVTLAPASGQTVTVNYTAYVASGDTAATGDFTATTGSLSFGPGDTGKTLTVATTGDAVDEVDETFTVTLSGPANATLGDATATGTIDDDDLPALSVADASGSEGGSITFTATLSPASEKTVTATWIASVESGDTAASGDLSGTLTGTLTFAAGDLTRTFTVATAEDRLDEPDETFTVTLLNLSNATLTGGTATGTIADDDGAPALRIGNASAAEGSAITFTATLSPASGQTVTVDYATFVATGDTATTGDFTAKSGTLSFGPGDTGKTFTVATTGDAVDEPNETFTVALFAPVNATLRSGQVTGTIIEDAEPPTLSVFDAIGSEGDDITFTAKLSALTAKTVTATWTASVESGDTAAGGDLTGTLTGTLTFDAGERIKTFTVATAEDTVDEVDETFTVTLSNLSNATLPGGTATGTIEDDDGAAVLRIADASAAEGDSITFTATLSPASGKTVTVNYATSVAPGDTAATGDFTAKSGSLSFGPGDTEKTITVATAEDTSDEDDETFTVTLSGLANATLTGGTATGTIEDDDDPPTLSVADASREEGGDITFTATLSPASGKTVTATWTASVESGDTAASGDLSGTLTGTLTFAAGEDTRTFTVATAEDTADEIDETFTVTLSGLSNATLTGGTATGTIEDDDTQMLSVADASGSEGDSITFTATLSAASAKTVTATWTASVESGDTAASGDLSGTLTGTLTFAPGEDTRTFTVATAEDTSDEPEETFTVTLSNLSNATLTGGTATGTIDDDDGPPALSVADASHSEFADIIFTATLSAASGKTVTATWTASVESGDTAASGDLTGTLTGTLTFDAGRRSETFTVRTVNDEIDEEDKTFTVTLSGLSNATLTGGTATGTIEDDDFAPGMEIGNVNVDEGETANFTATLSRESEKTVTVDWTASLETGDTAESADLGGTLGGTLVFDPGETSKPIAVATVEDLLDEDDETFTVTLTGGENATTTDATAQGTIVDDDAAPALRIGGASAAEGSAITFTVTLAPVSGQTVTVNYATAVLPGDTAATDDFTAKSGSLSFAAGERTKTFTVATAEDTTDEVDETFTVTLSGPANATLRDATATGTIDDDDDPPTLSVADASRSEGGDITFTATLSAASAKTVTATWATSVAPGDTATTGDFTAKSGSLSFGPGDTEKTFTVATTGDAVDEPDETFTVTLAGPANATLGDATATGTIDDDDDPPTLSVADASRSEGGDITFTATLSAASGKTVTATWAASVERGDTAASGDLSGTLTGTLSFAAGDRTRTFTVATAEDTVDEVDETFTVTLSNLSNATLTGGTATGTIEDDDGAAVLRIADASAAEGSAITFTATLSPASGKTVTVNYATSVAPGDTATTGDFTAKSGSLSFAPGDTEKTITVATTGDAVDEVDETFTVTLSGPANATLRDATAEGTIDDDDDPPRMQIGDVTVDEGDTATFTATLSPESGKTVTVTWTASLETGDTAAFADLGSTLSGTLVFDPGETSKPVEVATVEDLLDEDDETFTVILTGGASATTTDATAQGTIVDDDAAPALSVADARAAEGDSITFRVTLSPASGKTVTVNYATALAPGDTATTGDFTAKSGSLSFGPGDTEKTFTVATAEDTTDEVDAETFTVRLSGPANATLRGGSAKGRIDDDDSLALLSVADASGSEGDSITFTATLSPASERTVTATWTASVGGGDTAASGDLSGTLTGTLSFAPGDRTRTFTVATAEDTTDEEDETFTVRLSNLSNATLKLVANPPEPAGTATGTIEDDDRRPRMRIAGASAVEGSAITFTATLLQASGKTVTADYATLVEAADSATTDDFTATSGLLSFSPGDTVKTFTVATTDDAVDEVAETFSVRLGPFVNATLDGGKAIGTIEDNDDPPTLSVADASAAEGDEITFTATLLPASGKRVRVNWTASLETGDTAESDDLPGTLTGTLTFAPGALTRTFTVATSEDTWNEADETFTVTLSGPVNATLTGGTATGTIIDDDDDPNSPATGVPTVTGTARVGETLTAVTADIADAEGLPDSFSYQWVRVASGTDTDISGATSSTYTLAGADEGNTVKVEVSFIDDAGNAEGPLTSAATGSVAPPLLSVADASGSEGDSIAFTATLSAASGKTVTATWTASVESGDTAASGDLSGTLTGTLSFAAGDLTRTFTVATAEDTTDEPDETFTVTLSGPANATLGDSTATGTIEDDDGAAALRIADASAAEGSAIAFTVTLAPASAQTVTVNYMAYVAPGDTATTGDFTAKSGSLSFSPGDTEITFTVATAGDAVDEPDETFTVALSGPANATLRDATATGTIDDDDDPPTLSVADASRSEGGDITFTATLSAASGKTVTVDYATSVAPGDTAATGDFTAKSGSLSFAPGDTEKTFTVATTGDAVDEVDETFTVTLSGPANATLGDATATGTIDDDDDPPTLSVADAGAAEGDAVSFTATLSAASAKTVTATWTASVEPGDTAASGDLSGTLTGTLSFAAGDLTRTFTVATAEDTTDEDDETFTVTLSNLSNATLTGGTATGTIEDDDGAAVLRIADASAAEGSAITFTVTLSPASGKTVTVNYATSVAPGDTAATGDFTAKSGSLSFAPGDTGMTFTVATTGDAVDEPDETFTVTLSGPAHATLRGATATGTIDDDDDPPTLSVADASRSEGGDITFTATLSAASAKTVTATWTASVESGDTAASGDLSGTLTGTLSFAAGERTRTFTVATAEDTSDEVDETFTVTLSGPANATLGDATAKGTIDNDDHPPGMEIENVNVDEGETANFTATLSQESGKTVTVDWTASLEPGDTAAFADLGSTLSGTLVFDPGETSKPVAVATVEDLRDEDNETFTVTLAGGENATTTDATAQGTIVDDDAAPALSVADADGSEGDAVSFTATLSAASAKTVTATWTASVESGDTAASGDLSGTLTGTLTFAAGERTRTFTVATAEDTSDEVDETFTVTLSNLSNATTTDATAQGTIVDDDSTPALSVADAGAAEGSAITFTATLSAASGKTVTATWTASVESGDTAASGDLSGTLTGTLSFAADDLTRTFTVATAEDTTDEPDETFTVTLSNLSNATLTGGTATGTIEDDDGAAALRIADASAAEGSAIAFTVRLSPASGQTVTVNYATSVAPGDTAVTGDFTAKSGSLSFSPGDTEKTFSVATTGDAIDEVDETFTVTLSGPANATLGDATATGTIDDDDDPPTLSVADASREEGDAVSFTATLSAASAKTVTATWAASVESGDTAASGDLSGTLTGTLSFAAGDLTRTFTVATTDDEIHEDNETFTVTLSGLSNATLTGGTATGTINDNDFAPGMEIENVNVDEGETANFTATLSQESGKTVTVNWTASLETGDTAESADLGSTLSGTLVFDPGETSKPVEVATAEDLLDEDDETFTVTLAGGENATTTDATAQGTIVDDDSTPALSVADASGSEGDAVSFTATLSAASGKTVTATWTASVESGDTAASGDLSGTLTGTLSFAAGERTRTFTVATAEDTADEDDETFTVALSGLSNATLTGGTATGTIEDDDDPPTVGVADARAEEGENAGFTATLSAASEKTVTVVWTASAETGDTAEAGDLTGTLTARLSFAPGDLTKSFTVRTREDNVDEVAEETFTVTLSAPSNATVPDSTAAGTIADDDTTTLRVSGPASAVTEGGDAVFTVTLSTPNSRDIGATYETRSSGSDPATHGEDYVPFGEGGEDPGSLSIAAGETSATVTVTTVDDRLDESQTERFALVLLTPRAGVSPNQVDLDFTEAGADTAAANITDNDPQPVVELVLDPASIGENGGSARVTARMAGTVRSDRVTTVTVTAAAVAPAAAGDFALSGSELRIAAGAADSTGTVTLTAVDNDTDAPDKSVTVTATVANARGATAPAAKTLPIADDEDSPTVTLALSESSISEAGGTSVLTATLSHPSSEPTTLTVLPQAASFTLAPANGRLTIAAGATVGAGSVNLTAVDNRTDAPDNGLTVTATAANTQGVYDDADGIELTITDEDAAPTPMLVLSQTSIGEAGAGATVRVTLTHPSSEATTVVVAAAGTVDGAAEFALADATLTVPAGAERSSGSATIAATPNDTDAPDQVVTVSGTASNSQGIDGDPEAVELTIADDDAAPTVTLALASNPIAEENGSTAVTASLSHPSSEATTVTVTAAAELPAVAGDFAQSGSVLTIAAGDRESTGTVTVTATPNFVDATDKTVRVSATAVNTQGKAGDPANVNLTIADDDERGYTWSPETLNVEETAAVRYYMVALTSEPTADVRVTISDPGGDLILQNPENFDVGSTLTLAFTPVNWNIEQRIGVTANSDSDSRNETIDLRHAGAGGDYQGYSDTYRVTVTDDDKVANKVILTVDPTEMEEGGGGRQVTVTASLDGARRAEATAVTVTAGPGSADASDFTATPASFTLTIPAAGTDLNGSERRTVTITPANDDIDEDDETVRFSGTTTATVENSTTVLTVDPADVTIGDDDTRGVTLSTAEVFPGEGGSATYTVVLDSAPTGPVTVTPAVTGDSDVTVTPATLTFTASDWSTAQTVTVEAAEDDDATGDTATVAHTVADADYGAENVTAGRVAVTVTDNDERTLVLAPTSLRFDEGTSGTYTVALTAQPTGSVTVRPSVSDNPDVTVSPTSLSFTSTTWSTAQTVTVTARTDANGLEDRATVRHAISGADYGANGAVGPNLPVTVNDVATTELIALSVAPATVPENGRQQTVRVTARVDGAARGTATVVNVQVIGKTASPTDFTASPSALTVTIPANRQEGSATFGLTGTADTLDEGAGETIEVRGTSPSGLEVEPAEVTIADDDGRGLTLSRTSLTVNEQGTGTYTLRLASHGAGGGVFQLRLRPPPRRPDPVVPRRQARPRAA